MRSKSDSFDYCFALDKACKIIKTWNIDALVIPFGADTYKDDPDPNLIGHFNLRTDAYKEIAKVIRKYFDIPIVVTQEGGYCMDKVPEIVYEFINGLKNCI